MNRQKYFSYKFYNTSSIDDFYINDTNEEAFNLVYNNKHKKVFLFGPKKSGKSFIGNLWIKKNNGKLYKENNFEKIINNKYNILIDNLNQFSNEEQIFHIINHCNLNNKAILIISDKNLQDLNFKLKDLVSRIKTFHYSKINNPDDDMLLKILTKLFIEKQFIINSNEIFEFIIRRANRSYETVIEIVNKLDNLSLEKKRQLTIPLIKEIL